MPEEEEEAFGPDLEVEKVVVAEESSRPCWLPGPGPHAHWTAR
jgi:hypothetical protein